VQTLQRWLQSAKPAERMQAIAAALELIGEHVSWDRKAPFDEQIAVAERTVATLDPAKKAQLEAQYSTAFVMLHKRIPLAFKIKDKIPKEEFDQLRTGQHKGLGFKHYLSVFQEARIQKAVRNSVLLSLVTCIVTTVLVFIISYGINRRAVPMPELFRYGTLVPLVSPPVMIATAAILLFGRNGAITKGLLEQTFGWIDASETNLYGLGGVIVAQVFSFLPPAFIIMDNVLSKHDGRVEEAAASQGASAWQVFTRVTLPLAAPGIRRTVILVFILAMTDFGNPLVIGRDLPNLAGVLYDEMVGFSNTELSAALSMWMIVPALSIYFLLEGMGRHKRYHTSDSAGGPPELPVPLATRIGICTVAFAVLLLIVTLYGTVILASFIKIWGVDNSFTLGHYTTGNEVAGFVSEQQGVSVVWKSVQVAIIAAPLGGLLGLVAAFVVERLRPIGGNLLSFVALTPAILPGVIFGIGYVVAFNYPFGVKALALTGTRSILVLNLLFGHIYVGVLAGRAMLQRLDAAVDEAAEILGASLLQRFTRVTLPMLRHVALLGTLFVFVEAMTSLSSIIFLVSPGNELAAKAILDMAVASYYGVASALSVTMLLIVFTVMALMWAFEHYGPAWAKVGARLSGGA
jgi:iron(III) transport system permease protein